MYIQINLQCVNAVTVNFSLLIHIYILSDMFLHIYPIYIHRYVCIYTYIHVIYTYTQKYTFGDCETCAVCGACASTHSRCVSNIHVSIYAKQINGCVWSIYTVIEKCMSIHSHLFVLHIQIRVYLKRIVYGVYTQS